MTVTLPDPNHLERTVRSRHARRSRRMAHPRPAAPESEETAMIRMPSLTRMLALESTASDWFAKMSQKEQRTYVREHPGSKFAGTSSPEKGNKNHHLLLASYHNRAAKAAGEKTRLGIDGRRFGGGPHAKASRLHMAAANGGDAQRADMATVKLGAPDSRQLNQPGIYRKNWTVRGDHPEAHRMSDLARHHDEKARHHDAISIDDSDDEDWAKSDRHGHLSEVHGKAKSAFHRAQRHHENGDHALGASEEKKGHAILRAGKVSSSEGLREGLSDKRKRLWDRRGPRGGKKL